MRIEVVEHAEKRLRSVALLIGYYDGPNPNTTGHAATNAAYKLALEEADALAAELAHQTYDLYDYDTGQVEATEQISPTESRLRNRALCENDESKRWVPTPEPRDE